MPTLKFPPSMKFYVDGQTEFEVNGGTVGELVDDLLERYPGLKTHLIDSKGELRRYFNFFVNGVHIRELQGLETPLKDDDKVILMASAAGGKGSLPLSTHQQV